MTPTIKPTPTTCIAMSLGIPNREQASGNQKQRSASNAEAPQALTAAKTQRITAVPKSTVCPSVWVAAKVKLKW